MMAQLDDGQHKLAQDVYLKNRHNHHYGSWEYQNPIIRDIGHKSWLAGRARDSQAVDKFIFHSIEPAEVWPVQWCLCLVMAVVVVLLLAHVE